jgi:hypothetical protein
MVPAVWQATQAGFYSMNLHANDRIPFFFILGRPRSGTTLIRTLFDAHPNVKIPPEFPFIPLLARRFRNVKEWDARQILQFVDHLFKIRSFGHRTIDQLRINRLELTADLLCLEKHINLGEFIKRVNLHTGSWFPKLDIHAVGDKNPLYSIFISLLMKLIPDARFICLVRDYRDTYLSMGNVKGRPIEAPLLSLQVSRWRYVSRRFLYFQKKHPKRFILVSYEDFVADPVRRFRELTRFLVLPDVPSVFDFHAHRNKIISTFSAETVERFHTSLMQPVTASRTGLWKSSMTNKQIWEADLIAGKYADMLGYERQYRTWNLFLWLKTRPMVLYATLLFRLMEASLYLPYGVIRWVSGRIVMLVRLYTLFTWKKKKPDQVK